MDSSYRAAASQICGRMVVDETKRGAGREASKDVPGSSRMGGLAGDGARRVRFSAPFVTAEAPGLPCRR
jgi:hypothetical protein